MLFDSIRWTRTHGCFYIPATKAQLDALIRYCRGWLIIDVSGFEENRPVKTPEKTPGRIKSLPGNKIDPESVEKIEAMKQWMEQKRYSYNTIKTYVSFVKLFFSQTSLTWAEVSRERIYAYNHSEFIARKKSYSSQNQWINAIKMFIKINGPENISLESIERPFKERSLPNVLSVEEVQRILNSTPNVKHKTLLMLIYGTGLRIGEALDLTWEDIRRHEGLIYIRRAKGRKDRRVPLPEKLLKQLEPYYRMYKPKKYIFEGVKGGRYSRNSASQVLKRSADRAGIRSKITLHTLRHSFATHLTNRGINIQYIQEILGHQSPKTTMIYTHLSGKDIRKISSPLDDLAF